MFFAEVFAIEIYTMPCKWAVSVKDNKKFSFEKNICQNRVGLQPYRTVTPRSSSLA